MEQLPDYKLEPPCGRPSVTCDVCEGTGRIAAAESGSECVDNCACHKADAGLRDAINALAGASGYGEVIRSLKSHRHIFRYCDDCAHDCVVCNGAGEHS